MAQEDVESAVKKTPSSVSPDPLSTASTPPPDASITSASYRKLIRKLDLGLLPPLFILWFLSLMDRVNIGTARIQGLEKDVRMDPRSSQFNTATVVVFVGLLVAEVPSNWLVQRFPPAAVLCLECVLLGLFTMAQDLVRSFGGLVAMRFVVGVLEADLIPGSIFLLSAYYPRYELQWRLSMLHVGNAVSNAFGGLLALDLHHSRPDYDCGYLCLLAVHDQLAGRGQVANGERARGARGPHPRRRHHRGAWTYWTAQPSSGTRPSISARSSSPATLRPSTPSRCSPPTIVKVLRPHATIKEIQALVIPIFVAASAWTLAVAYLSDKRRHRSSFALLGCLVAVLGYAVLLNQDPGCRSTPATARCTSSRPARLAWLPSAWILLLNNVTGAYKTAFAVGMEIGLGNAGGFVAALAFQAKTAPHYWLGFRLSCGLMCMTFVLICVGSLLQTPKENDA